MKSGQLARSQFPAGEAVKICFASVSSGIRDIGLTYSSRCRRRLVVVRVCARVHAVTLHDTDHAASPCPVL